MGFGSPPPPPPLPSRKEKTQASLFPPSSFHLLSERTHSLASSSNNTTLPPLPTHTFPNVNCPLPPSPHTHNCLFVLACRFLLQRFPPKKKIRKWGGNVLSGAIRRRPQKISGSWLIYSDSLLFHHHRKIISPEGIPNIQKGFLEQISRVEGSLFFLLLACGWHWIFLPSYWGKMTFCVHIKRGRCIPAALLQAKRECVPFSGFFFWHHDQELEK